MCHSVTDVTCEQRTQHTGRLMHRASIHGEARLGPLEESIAPSPAHQFNSDMGEYKTSLNQELNSSTRLHADEIEFSFE